MTQETRETPQQAVRGDTAHDTAPPDWLSLASRCEAAKGADRELDADIHLALGWTLEKRHRDARPYYYSPGPASRSHTLASYASRPGLPRLTASIDAITSLIEREPGYFSGYMPLGKVTGFSDIVLYRGLLGLPGSSKAFAGDAATPALALCAAFCRAMHDKGARS
jgi:hypothetical protein